MRFLSSEVKFVDYDDRPFDEPDKASYTESRMNMFQPGNEFDLINDGI